MNRLLALTCVADKLPTMRYFEDFAEGHVYELGARLHRAVAGIFARRPR